MDFQIENIKEIMDGLDLATLFPKLQSVLDWAAAFARTAILVGPVIMLIFGLIYLFAAPREANYQAGYRCRWGMGSVRAWQFMQRLAGFVWIGLGGILTIVMLVLWVLYAKLPLDVLLQKCALCLVWQVALMVLAVLGINVTMFLLYDLEGNRRGSVKEIIGL